MDSSCAAVPLINSREQLFSIHHNHTDCFRRFCTKKVLIYGEMYFDKVYNNYNV